jgi:dimethylargininase
MVIALTREVTAAITCCELTHLAREPIDVTRARHEHAEYERALAASGCTIRRLPAGPAEADAAFIEDTAVVLDEVAVIARPGAPSRRGETGPVAEALAAWRPLAEITAPATLDGGDVLRLGRTLFVGLSSRTNAAGADALERIAAPLGYSVERVPVRRCLHLKTGVSAVAEDAVLLNRAWVDADHFEGCAIVEVDPAEPFGANALRVGALLIHAAAHPRTRSRLESLGLEVRPVELDELAKAEAGPTCCSLVVTTG